MQRRADTSMLRRLRFIALVLGVLCFVAVVVKLYSIQIVNYEFYQQRAVDQQTRDTILYPKRGTIYDSNMRPLAISADTQMVTLEAVKIGSDAQGDAIAKNLSAILGLEEDFVRRHVNERKSYAILKRGVEEEVADEIRAFIKDYNAQEDAKAKQAKAQGQKYETDKIDSIYLVADSTRYYPYGNFLSHVLGFVGTDQQGLGGLEYQYDTVLTGTPGRVVRAANAQGESMAEEYEMQYDPVDGYNLVLTVDEVLQRYLEKNLEIAYNDNRVEAHVSGIVMDVKTGGILAMANYPAFDSNDPFTLTDAALAEEIAQMEDDANRRQAQSDAQYAQWRNAAISDTYYAGSTFKIITAAIGLEVGAVSRNSHFFCAGSKHVDIWDIKCWRYPRTHGDQTLVEAIRHSCNPAFIEIGQAIGWDDMVKYHSAFGLDVKTGVDLPGEASGNWFTGLPNPSDLAVGAFGQNFPITPLQLITAVSAVANGGTLLTPHVVQEVVDSSGNVVESYGRQEVRQVISKETSGLMNEILESVVTLGTGKNAYTAGYRVAGKTGTTEKIGLVVGGKDKRISSFVAYAPADNPQIAVVILLDEPTVQPVTGGITVAPVIRRFMEEALPYLGVEARYDEDELTTTDVTVPDVSGLSKAEAEAELTAAGLACRTEGSGDVVTDQVPAVGAVVADTAKVILYMGGAAPESMITMPDLSGMSLDKAKSTLSNIGLFYRITGLINTTEGRIVVTRQSAEKDTQVAYGTVVTIELSDLDQQVT